MSPEPPTPAEVSGSERARRRKELLRYQAKLLELGAQAEVDFGSFLRRVLKSDATILGVERVSYWVFEQEPPAIRCVVLYSLGEDRFDGGLRLTEEAYPQYFRALQKDLVIVAHDAAQDERTRDFIEAYLRPAGITSMLDVPVWVQGRLGGVICHEHVGPGREWQPEEQAFAYSIGQLVSTALEAEERRKTERALRESEERFLLLSEHARDYALVLLDADGRIHAGAERLRGFRPEELVGQHVSVFFPPEDVVQGRPDHALQVALEQGRFEEEGWLVRKDGTRFWAQHVVTPLWTEEGELRGFASVTRDLTELQLARERERLLEETRQAEEQQRLLAHASAALVSSLEAEHSLTQMARLLLPLLADGCMTHLMEPPGAAQKVKAVGVDDVAHREQLERLAIALSQEPAWGEGFSQALREGRPLLLPRVHEQELARLAAGEEVRALLREMGVHSLIVVPLTARRRQLGVLTMLRHRTAHPYRERDLSLAEELARRAAYAVDNARLYQLAQEAIGLRDDFLSVASHELRTPLAALHLHLDGLERILTRRHVEGVSEGVRRKLESATRQVNRLARLIDDLLEVSRISSGRLGLQREEFDVSELVRELAEAFHSEAARAGSELVVRAEAPVVGEWDPLRLDQVLTNLLSNAIKFGSGRPVELEVREEGELARIVVRDHGIGIAEEDLPRLFRRFERAASARHYGGLGLGLYVSRQIVEAHQGTITVESQPGEGSTFTVLLPRHLAEARREHVVVAGPEEEAQVLH